MNSKYTYWEQREKEEKESSDSASGLLFMLVKFFFFGAKIAAAFGAFIYTGYLLSQKLLGEDSSKLKIWGSTILFTYLLFCFIFFLKGIIIGLRSKNRKLWILPWVVCIFLCCIVPAFLVQSAVSIMFNPAQQQQLWYTAISWGVFLLSLFYIYGIYQFKTPNAPRVLYWSFSLGLKVSR